MTKEKKTQHYLCTQTFFLSCNIQSISLKTSSKFNFVSKLGERLNKIEKKKLVVYGQNKRCFFMLFDSAFTLKKRHKCWSWYVCGKKRTRKSKYSRLLNWMLPKHLAKLPIGNFCGILDNFRSYLMCDIVKLKPKRSLWNLAVDFRNDQLTYLKRAPSF